MNRDHRNLLLQGRLVLISPYDPNAGFNVGHAMQRNKLIYALSDAALVVNATAGKGGTWAGAVEQLDRRRFVAVYVRSDGGSNDGLRGLLRKGAREWPNPQSPAQLATLLEVSSRQGGRSSRQASLFSPMSEIAQPRPSGEEQPATPATDAAGEPTPAEDLFAKVRELLQGMETPKTDAEVAEELAVSKSQARAWLQRLVAEGSVEKLSRPIRYRSLTNH
jgi:predicted Rossmann fold nucleotide-binding protein DprA/Smf involved in DNA uptake